MHSPAYSIIKSRFAAVLPMRRDSGFRNVSANAGLGSSQHSRGNQPTRCFKILWTVSPTKPIIARQIKHHEKELVKKIIPLFHVFGGGSTAKVSFEIMIQKPAQHLCILAECLTKTICVCVCVCVCVRVCVSNGRESLSCLLHSQVVVARFR